LVDTQWNKGKKGFKLRILLYKHLNYFPIKNFNNFFFFSNCLIIICCHFWNNFLNICEFKFWSLMSCWHLSTRPKKHLRFAGVKRFHVIILVTKTLKLRGKLIVYCQFFIKVRAKLVCKYFLIKLEANFSHFILILGDNFSWS
jgi:hypothetical protein